jgi:hypothetical protein
MALVKCLRALVLEAKVYFNLAGSMRTPSKLHPSLFSICFLFELGAGLIECQMCPVPYYNYYPSINSFHAAPGAQEFWKASL